MKNKVIEILKSENDGIEDLATRIDSWYSGDMKQCMYCEKTVEYSSGVFTCEECSGKPPEKVSEKKTYYIAVSTHEEFDEAEKSFENKEGKYWEIRSEVGGKKAISYVREVELFPHTPEKQSAKSAHTISEGEQKIIDGWLSCIAYHMDELDGGYVDLPIFDVDRELFERLLSNGSQSAIGEELIGTLRFTLSQLNSYHEIANNPGTTDCILKVKAAIKQLNKKS